MQPVHRLRPSNFSVVLLGEVIAGGGGGGCLQFFVQEPMREAPVGNANRSKGPGVTDKVQ